MTQNIYALKDAKTGFLPIQLDQNDSTAIRNLRHAVMDKSSILFTHANDFSLYHLGVYEMDSGTIIVNSSARHVVDAVSLIEEE